MNYRHAYHAGNFADVLKHLVLFALLENLKSKASAFCLIDTHAGQGCYALDGVEANATGEYKEGIARLLTSLSASLNHSKATHSLPALLRQWLDLILNLSGNEHGLYRYPGSPLLSALTMRAIDHAHLCELQSAEATQLRKLFNRDQRIHIHQRDGYEALKALVPPKEKRGLVFIDPPYEAQETEYLVIQDTLKAALHRWPTGMYAVWYPIKQRSQVQPFLRWMTRSGAKRVLCVELSPYPANSPLRLNGSGIAILNAPWNFDEILHESMLVLSRLLSKQHPIPWKIAWLLKETPLHQTKGKPL